MVPPWGLLKVWMCVYLTSIEMISDMVSYECTNPIRLGNRWSILHGDQFWGTGWRLARPTRTFFQQITFLQALLRLTLADLEQVGPAQYLVNHETMGILVSVHPSRARISDLHAVKTIEMMTKIWVRVLSLTGRNLARSVFAQILSWCIYVFNIPIIIGLQKWGAWPAC